MDGTTHRTFTPRNQWPDFEQQWYNLARCETTGEHWSNLPTYPAWYGEIRSKAFHTEDKVLEQCQHADWLTSYLASHELAAFDHEAKRVYLIKRVVLIDHAGKCLAMCSNSAIQGVRDVIAEFGKQPWIPPLMLSFNRFIHSERGEIWTVTATPYSKRIKR